MTLRHLTRRVGGALDLNGRLRRDLLAVHRQLFEANQKLADALDMGVTLQENAEADAAQHAEDLAALRRRMREYSAALIATEQWVIDAADVLSDATPTTPGVPVLLHRPFVDRLLVTGNQLLGRARAPEAEAS